MQQLFDSINGGAWANLNAPQLISRGTYYFPLEQIPNNSIH